MQKDIAIPFTLANGSFRGTFLRGTDMIQEMITHHKTGPLETLILGQAYLAGALLGQTLKNKGRVQLKVESDGPAKGFSVEATSEGDVRGFLFVNPIHAEHVESLEDLMGPGDLSVTRLEEGQKQPFRGSVPYFGDPLPLEMAHYFASSEQTPTAFLLSLQFDDDNRFIQGAGLFLQALPGCDDELRDTLHAGISAFLDPAKALVLGQTPEEYIQKQFEEYEPTVYDGRSVRFFCGCTKNQFTGILKGMAQSEKDDILENGPFPLTACCFYCGTNHTFEREELELIFVES